MNISLPQQTAPYLPVTIGLLGLIVVLETWPAAYRSVRRMRLVGLLLAALKLLALSSAALAIWFLGFSTLRAVIVGSLVYCGALTLYREFQNRWAAGDRSWSSLLGGITVVVQFLSLVVLGGAAAASLLTLLLGPVQALRGQTIWAGMIVAWVENFAGVLWLLALYYTLFYLLRRILGSSGFSWTDPPNWRTLLPHLKYGYSILAGRRGELQLADTVRMAYIHAIATPQPAATPLEAIERTARIQPLQHVADGFSFAILGDPGEGDKSQIRPYPQHGQTKVFRKAMQAIDASSPMPKGGAGTDEASDAPGFLIISSDVVYPAGELMDYERALYRPYRRAAGSEAIPIYAIPGNHDWYNDLRGFFLNFGYAAAHERRRPWARAIHNGPWAGYGQPLAELRWHEVERLRKTYGLTKLGGVAGRPATQQRLPFFEMVFKGVPLTILGLDTGCSGSVDPLQRAWLRRRLQAARRQAQLIVVVLSEPVYVDGGFVKNVRLADLYALLREYEVDVVMGGDTHAYQHYEVRYRGASGRSHTAHHFVNGGAGAYLSWPIDFTWRLAARSGPLDRDVVYRDPASGEVDQVLLRAIFPTADDMRRKFGARSTGGWLQRSLQRFESWLLEQGWTNALDHDRPPLQQSFITARMVPTGAGDAPAWELQITPWFSHPQSGELVPQPAIRLPAPAREPIWAPEEV